MAAVNEHVLLSQPDKLVLLAEIPAADSQAAVVTFRLLVEQCTDYGGGTMDVETVEDVACRVPLRELGRQGAAYRAFGDLVARLDNPMLRPEVATETRRAAARFQARCDAADELGLGGVELRLRVMFIDAFEPEEEEEDDEGGSDMEFGEFDLSGARNLQDYQQQTGAGHEDDDEDEDGCGAQFSVRPYRGGGALAGEEGNLLLSGFEARSDGPELTEQHELTSHDMRRLVHLALEGGGSMEDDEAYQRAMAGGTPLSRASRAAMVDQALQSANQRRQQFRSPSQVFPMRTGF
ncbi:uncharacterized protein LOC124663527 [Lolium rigidum]|uniref:uncharacterized protein LOC124663527 n=1 Tax=Lolium rigidum TaxID=89674 RepID=UPI001F5CEB15|nr:uncharacterized protein LOC124663527 [Lolium rigidum]